MVYYTHSAHSTNTSDLVATSKFTVTSGHNLAVGEEEEEEEEERAQHCHVMRVTPGTSAAMRGSVSLISEEAGRRYPFAVMSAVYSLFMRVGEVKMWPEGLQPAGATMVAGGLAFLSVAVEGLVESAVREGIGREEALQMAASCMGGLAKLIARGESPSEVTKKVATPGGECGNIYIEWREVY